MADPTRAQLDIPDDLNHIPEEDRFRELLRLLRLTKQFTAQEVSELEDRVNRDPRMSDTRVAHGLRVMEGVVLLDKATLAVPQGSVFYLLDRTYGVFGAAGTPAPTDPGTGPAIVSTHTLLDGTVHTDTSADTPSRGSIIVGSAASLWDEKASPGSASVLINDATDMAYRTIPTTRSEWLEKGSWDEITAVPVVGVTRGTAPDAYRAWAFNAVDYSVMGRTWRVPADWLSGNVSASIIWTTDGAAALNWQPVFETLSVADGDNLVGAGVDGAPSVISANVAADIYKKTVMSTFTVSAGADFRLVVGRNPGAAGDTFTGGIHLVAVELSYTPIY